MPWIVVSLNAKDFASLCGLFCHWNLTFLFLRKAFSNIDKNNWWNIWHFKCFCWAQISNCDILFFRFLNNEYLMYLITFAEYYLVSLSYNIPSYNLFTNSCTVMKYKNNTTKNHFKTPVIDVHFSQIMKHEISFLCELMVLQKLKVVNISNNGL